MPCSSRDYWSSEDWENHIRLQKRKEEQLTDFTSLTKDKFIDKWGESVWNFIENERLQKIDRENKWMQSDHGKRMLESINNVFGRTAMTSLLCEAMKLIESKGIISETSEDLRFWFEIHKRQDDNIWNLSFDEIKMFENIASRRRVKIY